MSLKTIILNKMYTLLFPFIYKLPHIFIYIIYKDISLFVFLSIKYLSIFYILAFYQTAAALGVSIGTYNSVYRSLMFFMPFNTYFSPVVTFQVASPLSVALSLPAALFIY